MSIYHWLPRPPPDTSLTPPLWQFLPMPALCVAAKNLYLLTNLKATFGFVSHAISFNSIVLFCRLNFRQFWPQIQRKSKIIVIFSFQSKKKKKRVQKTIYFIFRRLFWRQKSYHIFSDTVIKWSNNKSHKRQRKNLIISHSLSEKYIYFSSNLWKIIAKKLRDLYLENYYQG